MRYFKLDKLVRDKIIDHMHSLGEEPRGVRKLGKQEYLRELIRKIIEEAKEILEIKEERDMKKEVSDLQIVLDYIKKEIDISKEEIDEISRNKAKRNGGFNKRFYIHNIGVEDDDKWLKYYLENPEIFPEITEEDAKKYEEHKR